MENTTTYELDTIAPLGFEWAKHGKHRVYLDRDDINRWVGLEVQSYKTGSISSASLDGEHISNSEAGRLLGAIYKVYWDAADQRIHILLGDHTRTRSIDTDEMARRIHTGIANDIAKVSA